MSFVVLVESSRLKECVAYLFSFHISKNQKNTLFKGAKVPSPLNSPKYPQYEVFYSSLWVCLLPWNWYNSWILFFLTLPKLMCFNLPEGVSCYLGISRLWCWYLGWRVPHVGHAVPHDAVGVVQVRHGHLAPPDPATPTRQAIGKRRIPRGRRHDQGLTLEKQRHKSQIMNKWIHRWMDRWMDEQTN